MVEKKKAENYSQLNKEERIFVLGVVDKAIAIVLSFILQLAMTAEGDIPTVIDEMKQEVVCRPVCDLLRKVGYIPD